MRLLRRGNGAPSIDLLAAGLGNPGREYASTRHNVGFMVIDELARRLVADFRGKFCGRLAQGRLGDAKVALLKPETFMNCSGDSVGAARRFFKLDVGDILVVHDEVDLPFGRLQVRAGGGLAGHNGLRSVAGTLGGPDFLRIRVGVGRPERGDPRPVADFVLSPFEPEADVETIVARAADAVECVVQNGLEVAQQRFNER